MAARYLPSVLLVLLFADYLSAANSQQKALVDSLLSNYKQSNRPVKNQDSDALTVNVKAALVEVSAFNEATKLLSIKIRLTHTWTDQFLHWTPSDRSGIESVNIPISKIWKPDTIGHDQGRKTVAAVTANGTVTCVSVNEVQAECGEHWDTTKFPRDQQTCVIKLKSNEYKSSKQLVLAAGCDKIDVSGMKPTALVAKDPKSTVIVANSTEARDTDDDSTWPELVFSLIITRGNADFYTHFIIFPLMVLALLTALPYVMEPDSQFKVPFACAIFVAFWIMGVLLYLVMGEAVKYALGGSPLIAIFWRYNAIQSSFTIIQAAATADMCHRKKEAPQCLKTVCMKYFGFVLLCGCCKACKGKKAAQQGGKSGEEGIPMTSAAGQGDVRIEVAKEEDSGASKAETIAKEWHTIAACVDRFFFLVFLIHAIVMIFMYLP